MIFVGDKNGRIVIQQDCLVSGHQSQLRQRYRMLDLLGSPRFLAVQSDDLNQPPPPLTTDLPGDCLVDEISRVTNDHRLAIAGELQVNWTLTEYGQGSSQRRTFNIPMPQCVVGRGNHVDVSRRRCVGFETPRSPVPRRRGLGDQMVLPHFQSIVAMDSIAPVA